jgi:alpha-aminoadipate carrier protein LysW
LGPNTSFLSFCRAEGAAERKRLGGACPRYKEKNIMTQCPECEAEVTVRGLMVGEILFCPDCNAELEVINVEQPKVALAPQVEEDWGE